MISEKMMQGLIQQAQAQAQAQQVAQALQQQINQQFAQGLLQPLGLGWATPAPAWRLKHGVLEVAAEEKDTHDAWRELNHGLDPG